jgi:hypothetical protein
MIYISFKNNDYLNPDLHQQIFDNINTSILSSSDFINRANHGNDPTGYLKSSINSVDKLFCLPFTDGEISYFSELEIKLAIDYNIECYYVSSVFPFQYELITDINNYTILTLEETNIKINQELI